MTNEQYFSILLWLKMISDRTKDIEVHIILDKIITELKQTIKEDEKTN